MKKPKPPKRSEVSRIARKMRSIIETQFGQDVDGDFLRALAAWHLCEVRKARGRTSRHPRIETPVGVPVRITNGRSVKRWFRGANGVYEGPCRIVPGMVTVRVKGEPVAFEPRDVVLVPKPKRRSK